MGPYRPRFCNTVHHLQYLWAGQSNKFTPWWNCWKCFCEAKLCGFVNINIFLTFVFKGNFCSAKIRTSHYEEIIELCNTARKTVVCQLSCVAHAQTALISRSISYWRYVYWRGLMNKCFYSAIYLQKLLFQPFLLISHLIGCSQSGVHLALPFTPSHSLS
jgi:hypothetical protein